MGGGRLPGFGRLVPARVQPSDPARSRTRRLVVVAPSFRRGGVDRLLVPAPWTRTIEELCAEEVHGEVYAHEVIEVPAGTAWDLLNVVQHEALPVLEKFGWELAGAWVTSMCNEREVILLWAIPTWEAWSAYESAQRSDRAVSAWGKRTRDISVSWDRVLLVDAPLCPFRTGRQPRAEDRAEIEGS